MKLYCFLENRNWRSNSIWRSIHDFLNAQEDLKVKCILTTKYEDIGVRKKLISRFMDDILSFTPDCLLLFDHFTLVSTEQLAQFKEKGIIIVSFGIADPNLFDEARVAFSDCYYTMNLLTYKIYRKKHPQMRYLHSFCDPKLFKRLPVDKEYYVAFFGSGKHPVLHDHRIQTAKRIREAEIALKIFGKHWNLDEHSDNHPFVTAEYPELLNKTRISVDLTDSCISLGRRLYESALCSVPSLTLDREDVRELFEEGSEILLYRDTEDLIRKLKFFSKPLRFPILHQIGENARQRALENYTLNQWMQIIFKRVNELKKEKR